MRGRQLVMDFGCLTELAYTLPSLHCTACVPFEQYLPNRAREVDYMLTFNMH
jgi:hypothetical protein